MLADKGLKKVEDVIMVGYSDDDMFLLNYAQKLIYNNEKSRAGD